MSHVRIQTPDPLSESPAPWDRALPRPGAEVIPILLGFLSTPLDRWPITQPYLQGHAGTRLPNTTATVQGQTVPIQNPERILLRGTPFPFFRWPEILLKFAGGKPRLPEKVNPVLTPLPGHPWPPCPSRHLDPRNAQAHVYPTSISILVLVEQFSDFPGTQNLRILTFFTLQLTSP